MEEIYELFRKMYDEHFNREYVLTQAYIKASEDGLLTQEEKVKLAVFMANHPHAKYSMKMLKDSDSEEARKLMEQHEKAQNELLEMAKTEEGEDARGTEEKKEESSERNT